MQLSETGNECFAFNNDLKEIEVKRTYGTHILDQDDKPYIDFSSGYCVGNFGWNLEDVRNAIKNFSGPTYVSPNLSYKPWVELADLLAEITPGNLMKSFRATGGTEAVEIALQAAMEYTGRNKFIGIDGAYHGNSLATRGLVEDLGIFNWKKLKTPLTKKSLTELEKLLKDEDVAAFIMEPVITNLSVEIPEQEFMAGMQELCRKYGTLIIMDEVATGFGRTGKIFATEHFNIAPDIMCLGKSLSNGGAGIGATIMTQEVAEDFQDQSFPYSTYGWHPLGVEAALASIRYMQRSWTDLEENIKTLSAYFRQRLGDMKFKSKPEINIMGLAIALKFDDEDYAQEIVEKAQEQGLILSEEFSMYPALNMEFEVAQEGLDIIESCL